ncbi:hypothetical protein [Shewanella waksmanii]|uniref:hypothetical protein n=1 Tax=Shewanella waksmanii TaxID=213783 RepID=UPI00048D6887|nr:hypothetical protein [Shewanella waksmanii]
MTSAIDQVLAAAQSISQSGRTPTLALIKTKLGTSVAMPMLIQGLQQYKSMSAADQQAIAPLNAAPAVVAEPKVDDIESLLQAYKQLNDKYLALAERVSELESQAKQQG